LSEAPVITNKNSITASTANIFDKRLTHRMLT
jgi:hypothetical protein